MSRQSYLVSKGLAQVRKSDASVVAALRPLLAGTAAFAYKARGFHWNVEGAMFSQFHGFFGDLYEDLDGMVDDVAENIRKFQGVAPHQLGELARLSPVADGPTGTDPIGMCRDALEANEALLGCLGRAFSAANAAGEQGLMNYLADRIDKHRKWGWMLRSYTAGA